MVIDEIQGVPDLLYTVHQFIEDTDLVFFMTGSSARKLKKSGVNLLGARALDKKLHLLCYPEVNYRHPKGCQLPGFVENCFQHY